MALSDEDVSKQIKHMIGFIEQEADEKVEEITAKAEEEFNIEKGRLVQQQRVKIMEMFEKKEKHMELQRKIRNSNQVNASRLQVLHYYEEKFNDIQEEASQKLSLVIKDLPKYKKVLYGLILQALYQLLEPKLFLRCREADLEIVESALVDACKDFQERTNMSCRVTVDDSRYLDSRCAGGVEIFLLGEKIKVVNTLEKRLETVAQQMIPEIRMTLFGANPNRKHMD